MRTSAPAVLPLFRSEMQVRLLALLLLQPERSWTLQELAQTLDAPASSVHRELGRGEAAGIIRRDATARPHRFRAATDDPLHEPLATLLRRSVGVEEQLRGALERPDVLVAVIYGSWAGETRRPDSDIDVLVVGDADLRELRRRVRMIGKDGRTHHRPDRGDGRRVPAADRQPIELRPPRARRPHHTARRRPG